jgi:hypothetical protein
MPTLNEILEALKEPIPRSYYQIKKKGGSKIDYVAWYDLADLLDERAPGWEYHVEPQAYPHHWIQEKNGKQIERHGLMTICKASITIKGNDGTLTREAVGYQDPEEAYIGDELTNSEATALRRACAKLGLGREMWRKDKGNRPQQQRTNGRQQQRKPAQKQDPQLTPEQMTSLLRTMLDEAYQKGCEALQKAVSAANKRVAKFPKEKRPEVLDMIAGYRERLAEFEAA